MRFIVRPFERTKGDPGQAAPRFAGWIEGEEFIFGLAGLTLVGLRAAELGHDADGPYAVIEEQERQGTNGWLLIVRPEYDQENPGGIPGCELSVVKPGNRKAYEALARQHGRDSNASEIIVPVESSASIYFDACGHVDGCGFDARPEQPNQLPDFE